MKVFILRRQLDPSERLAIQEAHPGKLVHFSTIHSQDFMEHDELCKVLNPEEGDFVFLPKDRPIPAKAMERGIPHVALVNGRLMELLPLKPEFKDYVPKL